MGIGGVQRKVKALLGLDYAPHISRSNIKPDQISLMTKIGNGTSLHPTCLEFSQQN